MPYFCRPGHIIMQLLIIPTHLHCISDLSQFYECIVIKPYAIVNIILNYYEDSNNITHNIKNIYYAMFYDAIKLNLQL